MKIRPTRYSTPSSTYPQREWSGFSLPDPPDAGFWIVIDTREQKPYFQSYPQAVVKKLKTGDYSLKGFEHIVVVERKQVGDILGCIGHDRKRFEKELERMQKIRYKAIVIEGKESELYTYGATQVSHAAIRWSIVSFMVKYGVQVIFARNRQRGERWTHDLLYYVYTRTRSGKLGGELVP